MASCCLRMPATVIAPIQASSIFRFFIVVPPGPQPQYLSATSAA